jgi:hypothetical protein
MHWRLVAVAVDYAPASHVDLVTAARQFAAETGQVAAGLFAILIWVQSGVVQSQNFAQRQTGQLLCGRIRINDHAAVSVYDEDRISDEAEQRPKRIIGGLKCAF